jgi:SEC-C motif
VTPRVGRTSPSLAPRARVRFQSYADYLAERELGLIQRLDESVGVASITGDLSVMVGAGIRRPYTVELRFQGLDPFQPPEVWDRGGHFPPDGERHVEDHDSKGWRWCLWLPQAPEVDFAEPEPLGPFLEKVRGFIVKQLIYEDRIRRGIPRSQAWPGPAWAHGHQGHVQWIHEQLGLLDHAGLRGLLPYLLGNRLSYNKRCPCGSGKKAGLCHRAAAERIREALRVQDLRRAVQELGRGATDTTGSSGHSG